MSLTMNQTTLSRLAYSAVICDPSPLAYMYVHCTMHYFFSNPILKVWPQLLHSVNTEFQHASSVHVQVRYMYMYTVVCVRVLLLMLYRCNAGASNWMIS